MSEKGTKKRVEVEGVKYTVDVSRLQTWRAARMMAAVNTSDNDEVKGSYAIEFIQYVLGDEINKICDACGGDDASGEDVIKLAFDVIQAASKN